MDSKLDERVPEIKQNDSKEMLIQNEFGLSSEKRTDYLPWEEYFMAVAFLSAMRSKDPCSQVGACIVNDEKKIVAIGYNGMPRGCSDESLPWSKTGESKLDTKYMYVCHAELNAIMNKNSADVSNCTIYVVLYPCNQCAKFIIQSDIREVVYFSDKHEHKPETIASKYLLKMAGIKVRQANPQTLKVELDFCSIDPSLRTKYSLDDLHLSDEGSLTLNINEKRVNHLAWEEYFMAVAFLSSQRSKDPSSQVGACVVNKQNKIVGIGYNGMPRRCSDDLLPWNRNNKSGHEGLLSKYMYVCHAEMNAILNKNCPDVSKCRIYVALFPCHECAKIIIQALIEEVIFFSDKYADSEETIASKRMFDMAGVKYRPYDGELSRLTIDFKAIDSSASQSPPAKESR